MRNVMRGERRRAVSRMNVQLMSANGEILATFHIDRLREMLPLRLGDWVRSAPKEAEINGSERTESRD